MATTTLTKDTFTSTVDQEGVVLIDFWADWCGPCKRFGPIFEEASDRHEDVVFAKVDTEEERALAGALQISSIPTLMGFRDGILVFRQPGLISGGQLDDLVGQIKALDMEEVKKQYEEAAAQAEK